MTQIAESGKPVKDEIIHAADITDNFATKTELNALIENIDTVLDKINGEVV